LGEKKPKKTEEKFNERALVVGGGVKGRSCWANPGQSGGMKWGGTRSGV